MDNLRNSRNMITGHIKKHALLVNEAAIDILRYHKIFHLFSLCSQAA